MYKYVKEDFKEDGTRLLSVVPGARQRVQTGRQKVPSKYHEALYWAGERALVAHVGCKVSLLGDLKKPLLEQSGWRR